MASTGAAAWAKYYQGKGDLPTTVKRAGNAYDEDGKATSTILAEGTPVLVLSMKAYDSKPHIRVKIGGKAKTVRFKFDDLVKPGNKASASTSLKPQSFGVVGPAFQLQAYKAKLLDTIESRTDLDGPLKSYLRLLVEYWSGTAAAGAKIKKLYPTVKDIIPINDINKDFGEVLGPLAVIKHNILAGTGHKVTATSPIFIPVRPNEPLMDYKVGTVVISAKSGTTTNTVKPADILGLLQKQAGLVTKYKTTKEYQILETLSENPALRGPVAAVKILLGSKYDTWVKNNAYFKGKKGKYTDNELMYECEKYLQNESKSGSLNYARLFADAIKGSVVYIKFSIDSTGVGTFDSIVAQDVLKAATGPRPYLRTKNGYTRAADKMGIQI
jgi:hypothetical protein